MKWTKAEKKRILEYLDKYGSNSHIVKKGSGVETNYGIEYIALTDEDIKAIKEGHAINFGIMADEYAGLIFYRENKQ